MALDAARVAEGATVGGLLATGDAGPAALVYGSLRDLVIGVTLVLADGTVARSGGHVIKNVAGYDLAKVVHGSYGTLAVVAEVVLRLHPVPKAAVTRGAAVPAGRGGGGRGPRARRPRSSPRRWSGPATTCSLLRLEGTEAALPARADAGAGAARARAPRSARRRPVGPARRAHPRATRRRGAADRRAALPAARAARLAARDGGHRRAGHRRRDRHACPRAPSPTAHAAVHAAGGTSVLRARPAGAHLPAWGPPPSAVAVLRAVKHAFDPDDRLGPGRFDPWM